MTPGPFRLLRTKRLLQRRDICRRHEAHELRHRADFGVRRPDALLAELLADALAVVPALVWEQLVQAIELAVAGRAKQADRVHAVASLVGLPERGSSLAG